MDKLPRILVATSFYDNIRPIFFNTLDNVMLGQGELFHAEKMIMQTSAVDMFRNQAVRIAQEHEFDYLLFLDSDMGFPPMTAAQLLQTFRVDADERIYITAGLYNVRRSGFVNAVYTWNGHAFNDVNARTDADFELNSVYMADAVGTGCMMIDMALFDDYVEELPYPWFQYWYQPMHPGGEILRWSEDLVFGAKCYGLGVHAFVNTHVVCRHEVRNANVFQSTGDQYAISVNDDFTFAQSEAEAAETTTETPKEDEPQ